MQVRRAGVQLIQGALVPIALGAVALLRRILLLRRRQHREPYLTFALLWLGLLQADKIATRE